MYGDDSLAVVVMVWPQTSRPPMASSTSWVRFGWSFSLPLRFA